MSDLPARVHIVEAGPREGFQIEKGPIPTEAKLRFIEALAETGLEEVEFASFVNPKKVPSMADSEEIARRLRRRPGVRYTGIWLNEKGLERAVASGIDLKGRLSCSASEVFSLKNAGADFAEELARQRSYIPRYLELGLADCWLSVMTAFGCNYQGDIAPARVVEVIRRNRENVEALGARVVGVSLADTVGYAAPTAVERTLGAVREAWPELDLKLHLHDTRGTGLANAYAGLRMGVAHFDASCGGLGGCPFASHKGAAGNISTEDLVFMCEEMGIATGIDLDRLIACAHLAEEIVAHPLPGKVMRGGSLARLRSRAA
jgi:hydroxymethylglutaryl-CoA lyase